MLLIVGLGYAGAAVARAARSAGWRVRATSRSGAAVPGVEVVSFDAAAFAGASHVLITAPPGPAGDPVLPAMESAITARWAGYLSTTGVYGDRQGGWVDEATGPAPGTPRSHARLAAEAAWLALEDRMAVDIFRVAGIYGPGRSAFDDLRAGRARRIDKPGHAFSRIHVADIARAVLAAMATATAGRRIFNLADDEPAESAALMLEAAGLLGLPPPPAVPFAAAQMSAMAAGFWAENRRVSAAATKAALGLAWACPTYREGLRAILAQERADAAAQQGDILRP